MKTSKYRDITLSAIPGGTIAVAADSCASTGEKPGDTLRCPPYHCGRVSARVVLFELLCIGAEIMVVADGVCCEMEPTGREIIRGFQDELLLAGLSPDLLTGSTEENFPTTMTGVGTTAVGYLAGAFTPPACHSGDLIACVGTPLVGLDFLYNRSLPIADYSHLRTLTRHKAVRELVPVGSKGIAYEAETVAALHHLKVDFFADCPFDLKQSGGPSTCVLAVLSPEAFDPLAADLPITAVGQLKA